ncbi:YbhB/YbcL family Raf kinase inhibitor-like protein [Vogesella sp. LIG4]|uniref:YbhB/YbcL family Raf kinase inhibitor-like protein n=1 Tax=Vogesella sp. LIG4 TaxID=1192162 RepID=UPI00081F7D81|nr:YbhB/YbcL family Raf kinase inhibitor-like protein [Vogesella sp. LIG4]SCK11164.1 hypothetical protein PSELUDRAFT_0915 [Vogesella sp. LIG4]
MKPLLLTSLLLAALPGMAFELTSPQLHAGQSMAKAQEYNNLGCNGGNVSPALAWQHAPAGSRSFAVTVYDPDAPGGNGWWHWLVFNLPAGTAGLAAGAGNPGGALPPGSVQSRTDFGAPGYGGPCPPQGDKPHHYIFSVYALKVDKLALGTDSGPAQVERMLNANSLGKATLTASYGR